VPDNRNMVLFPEKINNMYVRLERPFPVYSRGLDRFDIWISDSLDLKYWGNSHLLMGVEDVPFANDKIGPGAPPIKTEKGWLTLTHAVDIDMNRGKNGWEAFWKKRYCAGLILLDLENPQKIIGKYDEPLLAPEAEYEISGGFRNNVIFPGGTILEDSGEVNLKKYGGFLMSQIGRISGRTWERLLKECGVDAFNGAQGRILYVLWEHKNLTISDIARLTSMANTTLTSMLDRMETEGMVQRVPDKVNRRQIFVTVTQKAREYREKYNQVSNTMKDIFYKGFTDPEIASFENQLRKILENLESE